MGSPLVLPQVCCKCLGTPDQIYRISTSYSSSVLLDQTQVTTTTYTLSVPYCAQCSARAKRLAAFIALACLSVAVIVWFVARFFLPAGVRPWVVAAAILLAIGSIPGALMASEPAKVTKNGLPLFDNGEYQLRFEEANRLEPDAYGPVDRFARDINVEEARLKREGTLPRSSS